MRAAEELAGNQLEPRVAQADTAEPPTTMGADATRDGTHHCVSDAIDVATRSSTAKEAALRAETPMDVEEQKEHERWR